MKRRNAEADIERLSTLVALFLHDRQRDREAVRMAFKAARVCVEGAIEALQYAGDGQLAVLARAGMREHLKAITEVERENETLSDRLHAAAERLAPGATEGKPICH